MEVGLCQVCTNLYPVGDTKLDELIRDHPTKVAALVAFIIAGVMGGLYKLGWLRVSNRKEWDGNERRKNEPCDAHEGLNGKVCALYAKMEAIDSKVDVVAERLQYILGSLEARWGAGKGR